MSTHSEGPKISAVRLGEPRIGHWRADPACRQMIWSDTLHPPFGRDRKDLPHSLDAFLDWFCGEDRTTVHTLFRTLQEEGRPFTFEARLQHPDATARMTEITAAAEIGTEGQIIGIFGVVRDITEEHQLKAELEDLWASSEHERAQLEHQAAELVNTIEEREETRQQLLEEVQRRKELEEKLRHLASTDPLTNISNRRHFLDVAKREVARALRYNHSLSVVCWDIDHFKKINDTYGHAAGDDAIRAISNAGVDQCRQENDLLGRMGGEEFAFLLPETNLKSAHILAERLRAAIEMTGIPIDGKKKYLTCSFGVAERLPEETDITETLKRADQALYRAKEAGRNRVELDQQEPAIAHVTAGTAGHA